MDKALKQRLVGAVVLIILAVIVLPMLLSGRSDTLSQESSEIELPAKPAEMSVSKRRFPVGVPAQPIADKPVETIVAEPLPENAIEGVAEEMTEDMAGDLNINNAPPEVASPADEITTPPAQEKPPQVTTVLINPEANKDIDISQSDANRGTPRYLVQVASFSSEKRANTLAAELRSANMAVMMDVVDRTAGRLHRVRVGPYVERSEADAVVASISQRNSQLSPRVMDMRPGDTAPVSTPSDPMVRWVVQVGSYSKASSADAQVATLQKAGLPAFSEKVTANGSSAYKVRVGPEIDRDKADALARKLKSEHQLNGFVTTQQ